MTTGDSLEEFELLLFDWEDGTIADADLKRLRDLLRTNSAVQTHYIRLQMMHAALNLDSAAGLSVVDSRADDSLPDAQQLFPQSSSPQPSSSPQNSSQSRLASLARRNWLTVLAGLLIVVLAGRVFYLDWLNAPKTVASPDQPSNGVPDESRDASQEATSQGIALLTRLIDARWANSSQAHEVGDALSPGRFSLEAGLAQVEFLCGATVIIEGPAELDFVSPRSASVMSGRLRAHVPPAARGFSVQVNGMEVVDLGTEFGLSVSADETNLQVFDGEVEIHPAASQKRLLSAGQAIRKSPDGAIENSDVTPQRFVNIESLESRSQGQRESRFQRWKNWSAQLRRDNRLIAYYAFDDVGNWNRRLASNREPINTELDGAIVGARRIPGRWPEKAALEFKRPADRVCVQIPGEFGSLSFVCWVKIDSLDRWYNSLFLTDNYNQGEPHWQILDTGQLFFSIRSNSDGEKGPPHHVVLSPPFWNPSLSGKWLQLASTFDLTNKKVTHYLNGEMLHSESIPDAQLVSVTRFGRATIGNWSSPLRPDAHYAIRNLNGRIDEFAVFSDALTAEEIREFYENGKP